MSTGKNRKKILIVGWMPPAGMEVLKKRDDVDYEVLPLAEVAGSYHKKLSDANAVTLGGTPYRQAELDVSPVMEVVARLGVGFDQVEVPALSKRKIPLMTTGIANSVSVAEHAMYMLLASARLTKKMDRFVRTSTWHERLSDQPADLAGKSIVVVGMGRIGSRTVKRCVAFEMDVSVLDPNISAADIEKAGATKVTDLEAILPKVDFVSVHCPKSPETVDMFNAETLGLMKPGAFLVNIARADVVDRAALIEALRSGRLGGFALDPLYEEPGRDDDELLRFDNVVLTPHIAAQPRFNALDDLADMMEGLSKELAS